ncbi:hypothetical protein HY990_01930 [Candidatus Micrarchaeota archaeon]|nr:hypothetical protein [Candidatus Micrarchaeota archaeon]
MLHRKAFIDTLSRTPVSSTVHVVNLRYVGEIGRIGQKFLENELGYKKAHATHAVRAATTAAITIGKPDIVFLGLFSEEAAIAAKGDSRAFNRAVERFHQAILRDGCFDDKTVRWTATALSGLKPEHIGALVNQDREPMPKNLGEALARKEQYERIIAAGKLEPILRATIHADIGQHILASADTLQRTYRGARLDVNLPLNYAFPIGTYYLPIAEKNGLYAVGRDEERRLDVVDALCSVLCFGVDPKRYFEMRKMIEEHLLRDLLEIKRTLDELIVNGKTGLIKDARKKGDFERGDIEIGFKKTGRIMYKLQFDPDIPKVERITADFVIDEIKDMLRGKALTGEEGDGKGALEKTCMTLEDAGFKKISNVESRISEIGGKVFWKVNLLTPPIKGRRYKIELQAVPKEINGEMEDGDATHALMQAIKLHHLIGVSREEMRDVVLSSELMRRETARSLLRQAVGVKSNGKDELPNLTTVMLSFDNRAGYVPTVVYEGATVADVVAQHINIATPGLVATINGERAPFRRKVGIRDMINVHVNGNPAMGIDRAVGIMEHVVTPEAVTQLAGLIFEILFRENRDGRRKRN